MAVYFIQHTKADAIKFVGHLDLQRALQRNLSRSGLKVAFSKGFNPHMMMSSAQPLSVGMSSEAEYLQVELMDDPSEEEVLQALNGTAPEGIRFIRARRMEPGTPPPMALLDAVRARIKLPSSPEFARQVQTILAGDQPMTVATVNKKGVARERDIRPLILPGAEVTYADGYSELTLTALAGSRDHLNLDHLVKYLREQTTGLIPDRFIHIRRLEMYTKKDGRYVSLGEI